MLHGMTLIASHYDERTPVMRRAELGFRRMSSRASLGTPNISTRVRHERGQRQGISTRQQVVSVPQEPVAQTVLRE